MNKKHVHVTLLDLPEILPFGVITKGIDFDINNNILNAAEKNLSIFVDYIENRFNEKIFYIGEDIVEEKLYKRYLFSKNGFFEVMIGVPVVISAHFIENDRAEKFADCLRLAIEKQVEPEKKKAIDILLSTIEINEELEEDLKFDKWDKMKKIRDEMG